MGTQATQGKLWSIAPEYWATHFEPSFLPIYHSALKQLNPSEGQTLLDDGCGAGLFSYMAAKSGAKVTGIDAAAGLLEVARKRNPNITFQEEELESLPFADESFDFVVAFNSLQYAGNFENALKEAIRVLKPGGKLAIAIWDKPEHSDAVHVLKAIGGLLPPPPPGTPGPFALSEDGLMETYFEKTGIRISSKTKVPCPFIYRSLTEGIQSFMGTGPAAAALNSNSREVVEKTVTDALQRFQLADDIHFLLNQFLLFVAVK